MALQAPLPSYVTELGGRRAQLQFMSAPGDGIRFVTVAFPFDRVGGETNDQEDARARAEAKAVLQEALNLL